MDQTGNPLEGTSVNKTTQALGETVKAVVQKVVKKVAQKAIEAAITSASAGTSQLLKLAAKGLIKLSQAMQKREGIGSITSFGGGGETNWGRLAAIGICTILAFLVITITAIAGAFVPGADKLGDFCEKPESKIILTGDLVELFRQVAKNECLPLALLMAISKQEAGQIWTWSPEEIEKFSTPNWWESAPQEEKLRGYCYDTCSVWPTPCSSVNCDTGESSGYRETTVYGPMQFEECTWHYRMPGYKLMDRCRLDLAVSAAGKKLHQDGGASTCTNWKEDEVLLAIKMYCGSCNSSSCPKYCDLVMLWYNEFATKYPNE
jgi:ribosomal protein S20